MLDHADRTAPTGYDELERADLPEISTSCRDR